MPLAEILLANAVPETWVAVAMATVSAVGGVAVLYVGYLGQRDKGRLTALELGMAACQEKHRECEDQHAETKQTVAQMRTDLLARDARDKADMQKQIDVLRGALAAKKDRTDGHEPIPE